MHTKRSLPSWLFLCALLGIGSSAAHSQESPGQLKIDPYKTATANGLNGAINLSLATLAIDDKSPMANSVSYDPTVRGNIALNPGQTRDLFFALNRAFERSSPGRKFSNVRTLIDYLETAIQNPPQEIKTWWHNLHPALNEMGPEAPGRGKFILNRFALIEYLRDLDTPEEKARYLTKIRPLITSLVQPLTEIDDQLTLGVVKQALYIGTQVRTSGGPTVYTPEMIYSNGRYGFDIAQQGYVSAKYGYGVAARYDLTPVRSEVVQKVLALDTARKAQKNKNYPLPAWVTNGDLDLSSLSLEALGRVAYLQDPANGYYSVATEANKAVASYSRALRLSAQANQRAIGDTGSFTSGGLSISQLWVPSPGRSYDGITFLGGAQILRYAPDNMPDTATVRLGVAVIWQDRVSRLVTEEGEQHGEINRWRSQFGAEFNFHNSLQKNETYGFFWRRRVEKFTELGISVGKSPNGRAYIGFNLGHTISL